MAQRFYTISLQDTDFPMLSEQQARTTIVTEAGKVPSAGTTPGLAYCHNMMPSKYGLDSVGYLSVVPAFAGLPESLTMDDARVAYGDARSRLYLVWDSLGNVYALLTGATVWIALPATVPATGGVGFSVESVTIGTVNGVSYIFYSGIGAFTYNEATNTLDEAVLTGLTIADVLGVVASSGYLIAYTLEAIAWSSTILPTDFVPSQVTGAGGGNVAGIAGAILFCTSNTLGILISTSANTIAGTYTGNARFPFKFREVDDSKGGISLDRVAYEANSKQQFIFSKAGLQTITSQKAESILPDVTDFLAGRRFEDYNEATRLYEITELTPAETMLKKLKFIASRYLVISYGLPSVGFTHALVFDTILKKLGKLKITHTDVFEYIGSQTEISKESIAFLLSTGEVQVLNFSSNAVSNGVVILGKLQFSSTRFIELLGVEIENVQDGVVLDVSSQLSLNGKTFTTVLPTAAPIAATEYREYPFRATGKSHSLAIAGQFNLTTVLVRYKTTGRR
jgi:hypothetical protein